MKSKWVLTLLTLLIGTSILFAQKGKNKLKPDSVYIKQGYQLHLKDSALLITKDTLIILPAGSKYKIKKSPETKTTDFYSSLEEKSEKTWLTKQLHDALLVETKRQNQDTVEVQTTNQTYAQYEGWVIKKITYKQVEIISGNVNDTLQVSKSGIIKTLNQVKSPTRERVLRKNTFLKIGDLLKPTSVADNERILRALPYIVETRIYVKPVAGQENEVVLIIVTQDQFSIGITPSFSSISKFSIRVYDRNLFGTGSEVSYTLLYEQDTVPEIGTSLSYSMDNIGGSFTNARINYTNIPGRELLTVGAIKQFITPQTKIGGGLNLSWKSDHWFLVSTDTSLLIPYSGAFLDVWSGYSPQVFSEESRKQLVISGRYNQKSYFKRPTVETDSNEQFANTQLLLASVAFRKLNYNKSKLLVGFGRTEDVPVGQIVSLTAGYQYSELASEPYLGIGFGIARNTRFGIWGAKMEFGGFINHNKNGLNDGAFSTKLVYYAPLQLIGRFSFRHSLRAAYLRGIDMPTYRVITLNSDIRGLSGNYFCGQEKLVSTLESVAFTPWYLLGFRFALYGFADIGFLGFDNKLISRDHLYTALGIGFRIRNENLVFNTIQIRLAFYSLAPENLSTTEIDFSTSEQRLFNAIDIGKPELVRFN